MSRQLRRGIYAVVELIGLHYCANYAWFRLGPSDYGETPRSSAEPAFVALLGG